MLGDSATVNPETVIEWKSKELPKIVDGYQPKDIFLMLMKPDSSIISSPVRHWHTKVILAMAEKIKAEGHCSARIQCWWHREITTTGDWKVQQTRLLQKSKKLPTKYTPNFNSRMTSATFEEFLVQLDCQIGAKNWNILLFIDKYAASPRDTTALKNIEVIFFPSNCTSHLQQLDMGIIYRFKC